MYGFRQNCQFIGLRFDLFEHLVNECQEFVGVDGHLEEVADWEIHLEVSKRILYIPIISLSLGQLVKTILLVLSFKLAAASLMENLFSDWHAIDNIFSNCTQKEGRLLTDSSYLSTQRV